ncbi:MAG: protein containing Coagulation factor 5/8 type, partial [Clostridia bacterium]|nr:protein containing Coagulation factor 5/8 type [Clostridia bacterium]
MNNRYLTPAPSPDITEGLFWPEHRALPVFASPAPVLDAVLVKELNPDEKLLFACLEGLVNRVKPRLFLIPERCDEGPYAWP